MKPSMMVVAISFLPFPGFVLAQNEIQPIQARHLAALCVDLDESHIEELESSMPGQELLEQIKGDWKIVSATIKGESVAAFAPDTFTAKDGFYCFVYPDDYGNDKPESIRESIMSPAQGYGYHPEFEAIEFRKAIYRKSDDWKPKLRRVFVFLDGDELIMVTAANMAAIPESLQPNKNNAVYRCRRVDDE